MILLDTCTLLWLACDPPQLPESVMDKIRRTPPAYRHLSAISAFEIGVKYSLGKLKLPKKPRIWLDANCVERGINIIAVQKSIACRAVELPRHHKDPADRMILATAMEFNLTILSPDPAFGHYRDVKVYWGS